MKLITLLTHGLYIAACIVNAAPSYHDEAAARHQIARWQNQYSTYIQSSIQSRKTECTSENIVYRQEWGSLSRKSRKEYLGAVQCLMKKPPIYTKSEVPGGRSRFDDFSATHINKAPFVHYDGIFFHWHRYFLWQYEQALRNECGYTGAQPYWDWTINYKQPQKNPVFDGSPYSMGSDGLSIPHGVQNLSAFGMHIGINPGSGGGCTYKGPFANHTITLGPVAFEPRGPDGGLGYNPRCLVRDLHTEWTNYTKPSDIVHLFNSRTDLESFDADIEGPTGLHTAGHFAAGGIMVDAWSSSQDPVFFLHHAGVDRMWSLWQGLKPQERLNQVYGTQTVFNNPPSANVTLDTELDFLRLAPKQKVRDVVSTIDGPFCYAYL